MRSAVRLPLVADKRAPTLATEAKLGGHCREQRGYGGPEYFAGGSCLILTDRVVPESLSPGPVKNDHLISRYLPM